MSKGLNPDPPEQSLDLSPSSQTRRCAWTWISTRASDNGHLPPSVLQGWISLDGPARRTFTSPAIRLSRQRPVFRTLSGVKAPGRSRSVFVQIRTLPYVLPVLTNRFRYG